MRTDEIVNWDRYTPEERLEILRERLDNETFLRAATWIAELAVPLWKIGNGYGGWVKDTLDAAFAAEGLPLRPPPRNKPKERVIPADVRRAVFERDAYRCRGCGGWNDLCVDHVHPAIHGGTDEMENLQTLCRSCNSRKGTRLPD